MDFMLTDSQQMIRKEVAALARSFSMDYWLGTIMPEAYGGAGLGITEAAIVAHEICAAGAGTSGASAIHFYMFPPAPIIKYGSEAMKQSRIQTVAEKRGDRWIVNGALLPHPHREGGEHGGRLSPHTRPPAQRLHADRAVSAARAGVRGG
jgi:hypothetical protein